MDFINDAKAQAMGLSAGRVAVGVSAFLAPERTARLFGFPKADLNASTLTMTRLFAVREIAIGTASLLWLTRHEPTRTFAALNLVVDGGDAISTIVGLASRRGGARANALNLLIAASVAVTWARILLSLGESEAETAPA